MRTPACFSRAFRSGFCSTDSCFRVYACRNHASTARLGITVARKAVPVAVSRNRLKRLVRESFRSRRRTMPALDMVVQAKAPAAAASNEEIRVSLERHWQELEKRCAVS
ncbi:MAG: ribonuclease P protein component [Gammaproteobacteria bacterium]